jgi:hypothetical protein
VTKPFFSTTYFTLTPKYWRCSRDERERKCVEMLLTTFTTKPKIDTNVPLEKHLMFQMMRKVIALMSVESLIESRHKAYLDTVEEEEGPIAVKAVPLGMGSKEKRKETWYG